MGRVKEEQRGTLESLQDYLSGGATAILDQADSLRTEVQRRIAEVGRGVEGQVSGLELGHRLAYFLLVQRSHNHPPRR